MIAYVDVEKARERIAREAAGKELGVVLKSMPMAVRHMGLVRAIEWLEAGKVNRELGSLVFAESAPLLGLPAKICDAVTLLETCERRALFEHHRRALAFFDALATLHRVKDMS